VFPDHFVNAILYRISDTQLVTKHVPFKQFKQENWVIGRALPTSLTCHDLGESRQGSKPILETARGGENSIFPTPRNVFGV
jgi:hypothetical protein